MGDEWNRIERMLGGAAGLERVREQVSAGRLDLSLAAGVLAETRPGAEAAARVVKLWQWLTEMPEIAGDAQRVEVATRLARYGSYPVSRLKADPTVVGWLADARRGGDGLEREQLHQQLCDHLEQVRENDSSSHDVFSAGLRQFRHRHLLRIFLAEIEGASVRDTTAEVADVAQVCLQEALVEASRRCGVEELADQICIFGMGKLGGRELNFSSDVDLVFVVSDAGAEGFDIETIDEVARSVVEFIDGVTAEGRVFRVDLRLRPEGSRGRLVPSESGLVNYCLNWGSSWERGVWLKARPVAGDEQLGERILSRLKPFLYRRYLDFEAIDELRRMKELIDQQSAAAEFVASEPQEDRREQTGSGSTSPFKARLLKKFNHHSRKARNSGTTSSEQRSTPVAPRGWDVKIGLGGIREIEFFVQALQLVHSGTRAALRIRTTLAALDRLLYAGLVSSAEHRMLADAYDLFRRLEHLVQMAGDRQQHRLPKDSEQFDDLAGRLGMSSRQLGEEVEEARQNVRGMFERLFQQSPRKSEQATVGGGQQGVLQQLGGLDPRRLDDESVIERLAQAGYEHPRQVAGQLQVLRNKRHGPFSETPSGADPQLAQYLLGAVEDAPDPSAALGRLVRFATVVGDTASAWSMLSENPHAARVLIHLFGSSQPMGGLLAEEPDLFERLIYAGSARLNISGEQMRRELEQRLAATGDRARRMGRIRRFHREQTVRIALHEVAGAVDVETTCRQLADLAELVLQALFREVCREFAATDEQFDFDGDPVDTVGLSVVAMGKLGGGEMGFGSDLDFIFVYTPQSDDGMDHQQATRVARRLVRSLSAATAIGEMYDVDLRLRPSGRQGTLVVSLDAWEDYHVHRAEFWERLTLVRALPITGTGELREAIEQGRRRLGFERPIPESAAEQLVEMRQKITDHTRSDDDGFDVKSDPGGLVDIEFITQWLQIRNGTESAAWRARSTGQALRQLFADHPGGQPDLEELCRDWKWLRRLECRLALAAAQTVLPHQGPVRRAIARQMGHQGREGLERFGTRLQAVRERVRSSWEAVFG